MSPSAKDAKHPDSRQNASLYTFQPKEGVARHPDRSLTAPNREPHPQNAPPVVSRLNQDFSRVPAHSPALPLQAKLSVNAPDDLYEQEADAVADTVMRMPTPGTPQMPSEASALPPISALQRSGGEASSVTPEVEERIGQMQGGGQPLPGAEQSFFQERMGFDLSRVRVHTDPTAIQTSRDIQARAFTVGNHIAFNEGEYQPGTSAGRHLLAHELTHVVQQGAAHQVQASRFVQREPVETAIAPADLGATKRTPPHTETPAPTAQPEKAHDSEPGAKAIDAEAKATTAAEQAAPANETQVAQSSEGQTATAAPQEPTHKPAAPSRDGQAAQNSATSQSRAQGEGPPRSKLSSSEELAKDLSWKPESETFLHLLGVRWGYDRLFRSYQRHSTPPQKPIHWDWDESWEAYQEEEEPQK